MSKIEYRVIVESWIMENMVEFFQDGKPLYRDDFLDRCQRYENAPTEFLVKKLNVLPDAMKWYLQIFQGLLFAGLLTLSLALFYRTIDIFLNFSGAPMEKYTFVFIIVYFLVLIIGSKLKRGTSKSPWLSDFIQKWFLIKTNLKELEIEMYYIAKILEDREYKK